MFAEENWGGTIGFVDESKPVGGIGGIEIGRCGFAIGFVGSGGNLIDSCVMPGTNSTTVLDMDVRF